MLSSELHSVRSLRRFPSVGTEYAAVVQRASVAQQYPYIDSCINVRQTCTRSFSVMRFTQLKKSVYKTNFFSCGHSVLLFILYSQLRPQPYSRHSNWRRAHYNEPVMSFYKHFFFSCVKRTTQKLLVQVCLTFMQEPMYGYCGATHARDTTAAYFVPTDGKSRKLRTEWSSPESIHHFLRVSTRRAFVSIKTIVLARSFKKVLVKVQMVDLAAPWWLMVRA